MGDKPTFFDKWPIWRIVALAVFLPFAVYTCSGLNNSCQKWLALALFVGVWISATVRMIRDWRTLPHGRTDAPPSS
jgi:hypothetical protein